MKFAERSEIDIERWNALVAKEQHVLLFSYSWYLDAVAENWCILVDDNYTKGIALPYTKRMGVEILYVPIFSRSSQFIGTYTNNDVALIKQRFRAIELATTTNMFNSQTTRVHQTITNFEHRKLSSQAKRSLKKAVNSGVSVTDNDSFAGIMTAIEQELQGKFKGVDAERISGLKKLFQSAQKEGCLKVFEVSDGEETGGIVCLVDESQILYLKGACPDSLKKKGGMYFALNVAIEFAQKNGLKFDFGGSNVKGVQRFNKNLGGVDQPYFFYESNKAPVWFRLARKFKNRLNR